MSLLSISLSGYLLISNLLHFVFAIALVIYMRVMLENSNNSLSRHEFKRFMIIVLVCLIADMFSYVFDMQEFPTALIGNHIAMFVSVLFTTIVGYWWNKFFDVIFRDDKEPPKTSRLYLIPTIASLVMLIINIPTGFIYYMTEDNVYTRGDYYIISFILQYISFAILIVRALIIKFDARTVRRARMRSSIVMVGIITVVFGIFQALADGKVAIHCLGITAGIFIMFTRFQDDQITNDTLTGLNNRLSLDSYVVDKLKLYTTGTHGGRRLYMFLMDVNKFKRINDNHGHIEGDAALKFIADVLKGIGAHHKQTLFLARFGGDEFAAVYEANGDSYAKKLSDEIKEAIKNETKDWKYWITISVGYAEFTGKEMTHEQLYELADAALYKDKNGADPDRDHHGN